MTLVQSADQARRVVDQLRKLPAGTHVAWDTEVAGIDASSQSPVGNGRVICASFFCGPEHNFGSGPCVWIDNDGPAHGTLASFKEILEDEQSAKVFHNFGFDRHVLFNEGIDVRGLTGDTMHMARLWDSARDKAGGYSLESLSEDLLGARKVPMKERFSVPKLKRDGTPGTYACLAA